MEVQLWKYTPHDTLDQHYYFPPFFTLMDRLIRLMLTFTWFVLVADEKLVEG